MSFFSFEKNKNASVKSPDKLVDGDLPFGWFAHNEVYIRNKEKKLTKYAQDSNNGSVDERIDTLQKMIKYYSDIKQEFYSKGECFQKYFQDMWEHCHNSRCDDFEFISPYEESLEYLISNYESLKILEEKRKTLAKDLYDFLSGQNEILQKDIYKHFDSGLKSDIQDLLYRWSKDGKIKRQKSGSTYKIYL